jgi:hypothetical protein
MPVNPDVRPLKQKQQKPEMRDGVRKRGSYPATRTATPEKYDRAWNIGSAREDMNNWNEMMRLLAILATTKILLSHSTQDGFGLEYPTDAAQQIDQIIDSIFFKSGKTLPKYWSILFAPTGPLQEIAIANGWSDIYLKLSEEFDGLEYILKQHELQAEPSPPPYSSPAAGSESGEA